MNKTELEKYINDSVSMLKANSGARLAKYNENYRRYTNCINANIQNVNTQNTIGLWQYDQSPAPDTSNTPSLNVIKSCVDTLASKIAQTKVRPFFNVVGGTFDDLRTAKQAQTYFDLIFDKWNVNKIVSEAFRECCIFDTGAIYIDPENRCVSKALAYQVNVLPNEATYGRCTVAYYERQNYPTSLLPEAVKKNIKNKTARMWDYGVYYDCNEHIVSHILNGRVVLTKKYEADCIPFVFLYYNNPIVGTSTTSVVDALTSIQLEIDVIMSKISDAMELTPGNIICVPDTGGVTPSQINNAAGQIMMYRPTPNMTQSPITVVSPAFIDEQYIQLLQMLYGKAYELVGISELSAQSKKPKDIESGIALATLEDVESERFETQLNQVVRAYVDIAKTCVRVFDKNEDILPESNTRINIKWRDICEADDKLVIQYSAADALSKDPSQKLMQIQQLANMGVISQGRIGQLLEMPDLETGFNILNNVENAIMTIISDCIKNDEYDIPDYIPLEQLKEEIVSAELSLRALNNPKNKKDLKKLEKLYYKADEKLSEFVEAVNDETAYQNGLLEDEDIPPGATPQVGVPQGQTSPAQPSGGFGNDAQRQAGQPTWMGDTNRQ